MDRPVATGRNILTGALKLLKRDKHGGALVVPAQATSCKEEPPDRSLELPKPWLRRTFLEVPADNLEAPQFLLRMLPLVPGMGKNWLKKTRVQEFLGLKAEKNRVQEIHKCQIFKTPSHFPNF